MSSELRVASSEWRVVSGGVVRAFLLFVLFGCVGLTLAQEKPTSLAEAQAAAEANVRTPEGKAYDEALGNDFLQKHLEEIRQCKGSAGGDLRSFWFLLKLQKDGSVKEMLLYPETKLGQCARQSLMKDHFPSPPRDAYWGSVYFKISH